MDTENNKEAEQNEEGITLTSTKYDYKSFMKLSHEEQKAEIDRMLSTKYADSKSSDRAFKIAVNLDLIMRGHADMVRGSGVTRKPLKGGPCDEGFTMGILSYIRGGPKLADEGTASFTGRGVVNKLIFFLLYSLQMSFFRHTSACTGMYWISEPYGLSYHNLILTVWM